MKPIDPGVTEPESDTWETHDAQAISWSLYKIGMHMSKSGEWMPP